MTTVLTPAQIYDLLEPMGFWDVVTAIAVVLAESGGNTMAKFVNKDGSIDRGLWQFNTRWHPEVTDAMAYDPAQASHAALSLSRGGRYWYSWSSYKATFCARQMPVARGALAFVALRVPVRSGQTNAAALAGVMAREGRPQGSPQRFATLHACAAYAVGAVPVVDTPDGGGGWYVKYEARGA